jgi:hypothetical protein
MSGFYIQGDICIERVYASVSGSVIEPDPDGATVLGRGEVTGHRHALYGGALMFRDDALARDIPDGLYIGHIKLEAPATLLHEEHDPIKLEAGTYRVRRQREFDPRALSEDEVKSLTVRD